MKFEIHHHHHFPDELVGMLRTIIRNQEKIMATLDEVLADVTAETTLIASLGTLITGLKDQLAAALADTTLPPEVQAKVDAIFAAAEANKTALANAVSANTPASPDATPSA